MSMVGPHEYEPDYDAYWRDLESLEDTMFNVATYDDYFPCLAANQNVPGARMGEAGVTVSVKVS